MKKLLRPAAILAFTVACVAWAMTGCMPYHHCHEGAPTTHQHSSHLNCPSCRHITHPTGPMPTPRCDHR